MQRYFITGNAWDEKITITGEDVHHIIKVMRNKIGDKIICNDDSGKSSICQISVLHSDSIEATVIKRLQENKELPIITTIAQGIPKGDKFEYVLQKGTELGANTFIPFQSERSVAIWNSKKVIKKMPRFQKIVKEAAEQCHRNRVPSISLPMTIQQLLNESNNYDVKIIAYEEEAKVETFQPYSNILQQLTNGQKLLICIGPEGGFSDNEVKAFKQNGFLSTRLGPRILRTETAPLYALAALSYHFEEQQQVDEIK